MSCKLRDRWDDAYSGIMEGLELKGISPKNINTALNQIASDIKYKSFEPSPEEFDRVFKYVTQCKNDFIRKRYVHLRKLLFQENIFSGGGI